MKYAVLFERTATGYSAHVPDLPGCIAAGTTLEETADLMRRRSGCTWTGCEKTGKPFPSPRLSPNTSRPLDLTPVGAEVRFYGSTCCRALLF